MRAIFDRTLRLTAVLRGLKCRPALIGPAESSFIVVPSTKDLSLFPSENPVVLQAKGGSGSIAPYLLGVTLSPTSASSMPIRSKRMMPLKMSPG